MLNHIFPIIAVRETWANESHILYQHMPNGGIVSKQRIL